MLFDVFKEVDGFMTPVEIFKPYYAEAIARCVTQRNSFERMLALVDLSDAVKHFRYIVESLQQQKLWSPDNEESTASGPIRFVEIGAGNGTCAKGVLDFIRANYPSLYARVDYTIVDVSKAFVARQRQNLREHAAVGKIQILNQSVFEYLEQDSQPGFIIGLEILDNLPHDKLVVDGFGHIRETVVEESQLAEDPHHPKKYVEKNIPIQDPVVLEYLRSYASHYDLETDSWLGNAEFYKQKDNTRYSLALWHLLRHPSDEKLRKDALMESPSILGHIHDAYMKYMSPSAFQSAMGWVGAVTGGVSADRIVHLPTGAFSFVKRLHQQHPNKHFILGDFDFILGAMNGVNAPLVQRSEGNVTTSYLTYLEVEPGHCDIFYPTNFDSLRVMYYELSGGRNSRALRSRSFLKKYADYRATRTKLGYNPLLQDFMNTKFFLTAPEPK